MIFKMTSNGVLTTLVSFAGPNGRYPLSGLVSAGKNSFFGTTWGGGASELGTLFDVTTDGILKKSASKSLE